MQSETMEDVPIQRTIKIGKATVGLIGLDIALNRILKKDIPEDEAVQYLIESVRKENYIPATALENYREAIRMEYRKLTGGQVNEPDSLTFRIFGPGCVSCNRIREMLIEIMQKLDIAADIEQIHELDEIWRHGVTTTPTLMINGKIKSSGRLPTPAELEEWIREVL